MRRSISTPHYSNFPFTDNIMKESFKNTKSKYFFNIDVVNCILEKSQVHEIYFEILERKKIEINSILEILIRILVYKFIVTDISFERMDKFTCKKCIEELITMYHDIDIIQYNIIKTKDKSLLLILNKCGSCLLKITKEEILKINERIEIISSFILDSDMYNKINNSEDCTSVKSRYLFTHEDKYDHLSTFFNETKTMDEKINYSNLVNDVIDSINNSSDTTLLNLINDEKSENEDDENSDISIEEKRREKSEDKSDNSISSSEPYSSIIDELLNQYEDNKYTSLCEHSSNSNLHNAEIATETTIPVYHPFVFFPVYYYVPVIGHEPNYNDHYKTYEEIKRIDTKNSESKEFDDNKGMLILIFEKIKNFFMFRCS